jgi:superfamily II DNA helicase RecQ
MEFRGQFSKMFISWIRSSSDGKQRAPLLLLTATLPKRERAKVCTAIGINAKRLALYTYYQFTSEEIFLEKFIRPGYNSDTEFSYMTDIIADLKKYGSAAEKCIIVFSTIANLDRAVEYLKTRVPVKGKVGEGVWPEGVMWARFDGVSTSEESKQDIIEEFSRDFSTLRLVVGTTSVIMGINMKTVSRCKLVGVPSKMWYLVQLLGRAGRDGCNVTLSLWWHKGDCPALKHGNGQNSQDINQGITEVVIFYNNESECMRRLLHAAMEYPQVEASESKCCSVCEEKKQPKPNINGQRLALRNFRNLQAHDTPPEQHTHSFLIPANKRMVLKVLQDHLPAVASESTCNLDLTAKIESIETALADYKFFQ